VPNSSSVFALGVAVKAKVLTLGSGPRERISLTIKSSRSPAAAST
jgi:hypothetical protein